MQKVYSKIKFLKEAIAMRTGNWKAAKDKGRRLKSETAKVAAEFGISEIDLVAWGNKRSGKKAEKRADKSRRAIIRLEDSFIGFYETKTKRKRLGICIDDKGIYYDCKSESRLQELLGTKMSKEEEERGKRLVERWREYRLTKYNGPIEDACPAENFVLVVDQIKGDLSIEHGGLGDSALEKMIVDAMEEWPAHTILIRQHPEAKRKRKGGMLGNKLESRGGRMKVFESEGSPVRQLERCDAIYTATSQLGFEGILWDKTVYTYGWPFYAGLGLTIDRQEKCLTRQRSKVTKEALALRVLSDYCRYKHPETKKICRVEEVMKWVDLQIKATRLLPDEIVGVGFTPWKRRQLEGFMQRSRGQSLRYRVRSVGRTKDGEVVAVWGNQCPRGLDRKKSNHIRVEDGFIRSFGLGSELTNAQSWIADRIGIYYDGSRESGIERLLLQDRKLTNEQRSRAARIVESMKMLKISKYNEDGRPWQPRGIAASKRVVLVIGQVESDASIKYGVPETEGAARTNNELLRRVRERERESWILYKAHPDTLSNMRKGTNVVKLYDEDVSGCSLHDLYKSVDEVNVITSLAGFEALINGKKVRTWGIPFYAGWGLTVDMLEGHEWLKKRRRRITLEELVYACLVEYPMYLSSETGLRTGVERVIKELAESRLKGKSVTAESRVFRYWGAFRSWVSR